MSAFKIFCFALSLALAAPSFAKDASRTRLLTSPNPAQVGQTVKLVGEVDGFGGGAPTGTVNFTDGAVALGVEKLSRYGVGQATLSVGSRHSCVLDAAGGITCWGVNTHGQLGNGTPTDGVRPPVAVSGLTSRAVAVTVGFAHSCALTAAGGVKCWGCLTVINAGDGICEDSLTPVSVSGLSTGVVAIAAGDWHTCALTAAGGVKCWGGNYYGLGDGTTISSKIPVPVSGLSSGVVAITMGQRHTCALTSAGAVKCWGWNSSGQLGDGTKTDRRSPVAVSGLSSGVVAISAAGSRTCALTSTHGVKCWGQFDDGAGRLVGSTPISFGTLTDAVAIDVGTSRICALTGGGAPLSLRRDQDGIPVAEPVYARGVVATAGGSRCVVMDSGGVGCRPRVAAMPTPVPGVTALIRARAPLSTNALGVGTHTLRATYSGDAAHSQSSGSRAQTIVP